jgi:hypothetical protein
MGLLDQLAGGGGGGPASQFTDFISRYEQGAPHEGLDDQETLDRYNDVAGEVDPETYESAAQESFSKMDPDSRSQFASLLQERAAASGYDPGYDGQSNDPRSLARMTSQVHSQDPGLLGSLLGGGGAMPGGGLGGGGIGGGGGLGGLAAGMLGGGGAGGGGVGGGGLGALAGNPAARAALGGIAAMVARRAMGGR